MKYVQVLHYTLKTLAYALCALGCAYQVISIVNIYFSFPVTVFSFIKNMDTLKLPAISICNNNRIMLSKLRSFDASFNRTWHRLLERAHNSRRGNTNRTKMMMQRFIDRTTRRLMDRLSVHEFAKLGHQWDELISPDFFKCATDPFNLNHKCLKYANIIETAQEEGNCFTIFGRSKNEFLKTIAIKSGLSQSPVIRGIGDSLNLEIAEQPFHPNEIFRVMLNFSVTDYTTSDDKIKGYVMIHDENELPPIREKNFIVYPGFFYELYVTKESGEYLPKPYMTDCVDYSVESYAERRDNEANRYMPAVLSRETCIMNCLGSKSVQWCRCWPPELPFVLVNDNATEAINSTERQLKWCSWRDGANIDAQGNKSDSASWFRYCFSSHEHECTKQCKIQCNVDKYNAARQSFVWPSNERISHSTKYKALYRKCCAIISLRYWSAEQISQKYEPKYEFVEFFAYFGGLLSIWLGFSLVKTYDVFEMVVKRGFKQFRSKGSMKNLVGCCTHRRRHRRPSSGSQMSKNSLQRANRPRVAKYYKTQHVHGSI